MKGDFFTKVLYKLWRSKKMIFNNFREIISFISTNGTLFSSFVYFLLISLFLEIIIIFFLNSTLMKLEKNIERNIDGNSFYKRLIDKYQKLLKRQYDLVNTRTFINNYFLTKKKRTIFFIDLLEHSDYFYVLVALLASFIISLSAIIKLNLENISGIDDFIIRVEEVLYIIKPALFFLVVGIVAAIIINLFKKIFNLEKRLENIKFKLENHLENNIKYKYNYKLKQLSLMEELTLTIKDRFISLENLFEDCFLDFIKDNRGISQEEKIEKIIKEVAISKEKADRDED